MLEGGGEVTTTVRKLRPSIANVATVLKVVDQLIHKCLVRVKNKFSLEDVKIDWSVEFLIELMCSNRIL